MRIFIILHILILFFIIGCQASRAIYGVPEATWVQMNETERQATIERFNQQEAINAQTRLEAEKAKEAAEEFARQCHQTEKPECQRIQRRGWLNF